MKILFICVGNINRSIAAEMVMRSYPGLDRHEIKSAALNGKQGILMNNLMCTLVDSVLESDRPERPRSTALTKELLDWSDVIFYMQEANLKRLERDYGTEWSHKCKNITYCTEGLTQIRDPHFTATQKMAFQDICKCIYNIIQDLNL